MFGFSAQEGTQSGSISDKIARPITDSLAQRQGMTGKAYWKLYAQVDFAVRKTAHFLEYTLLGMLLTLLLVAIGLLVLFSASYARAYYETKNAASVFVNQLIFAVMGIGVMWLISRVPYEWYQKLSLLILAASIGLLVLVPFIGTESGGATRWLDFGFVSFQPSEIAKFGVVCRLRPLWRRTRGI